MKTDKQKIKRLEERLAKIATQYLALTKRAVILKESHLKLSIALSNLKLKKIKL